jgi:signal transduction histidine kinase
MLAAAAVFVLAALVLLALVIVSLSAPPWATIGDEPAIAVIIAQLTAGAFAAALVVAALCFVCWRLTGEARLLWLGVAAVTYALFTLDPGYIEAVSSATGNDGILLLRPAGKFVAVALVVGALLSPEVDAALRPMKLALSATVAVAMLTIGLQLLPGAARLLVTIETGNLGGPFALATAWIWVALGVWSLLVGDRRQYLLAWVGLLLLALGFAGAVERFAATDGSIWTAAPAILRLFGFLCAVAGTTAELARAYVRQGSKLLESVTSERTAEALFEAERATQEERAHEARNALAAIEAATRTLQRYQDALDEDVREQLAEAVTAEVHRLQRLVSGDPASPSPGRFRITEALAAVVTSARWQGLTIMVDVPESLVAIGQPADTAQVLHNLFQNASRYSGRAVTVRGCVEGDQVVVRVEDDGPGIPLEERESIFSRGFRGTTAGSAPGSGLGLYVAARLMREQGGDLRVEDDHSGGACFVMSLTGFSELAAEDTDGTIHASPNVVTAVEQPLDEVQEGSELGVVRQHSILAIPRHRKHAATCVENEDGVRDDVAG